MQYVPFLMNSHFISYYIVDKKDELIYAGVGKLPEIIKLNNIRKYLKSDQNYNVVLNDYFPYHYQARNDVDSVIHSYLGDKLPEINWDMTLDKATNIVCVETGQTFKNQSELALTLNISTAMVSNHLNDRCCSKSIKGLHYVYGKPREVYQPSTTTSVPLILSPRYSYKIGKFNTNMIGKYVVYSVHDINGTPLFLGIDKFETAILLLKVKLAEGFDINSKYNIQFQYSSITEQECKTFKDMTFGDFKGPFNNSNNDKKSIIICNETGEKFNTQSELARAIGVTESRVSKHLNRLTGFKSIYNKTYVRI